MWQICSVYGLHAMLFVTLNVFIKWLPETAHTLGHTNYGSRKQMCVGSRFGDTTLIALIQILQLGVVDTTEQVLFFLLEGQSLKLIMKSKGAFLNHLFLLWPSWVPWETPNGPQENGF